MQFKNNELVLAPLAGITDRVFRSICRECGADIVFSEMISAEGILYDSADTFEMLSFCGSERPVGIQLFGSKPDHMARAAAIIEERVHPDFIDLNAGCPVPKVVRRNGGASLLRDGALFEQIVRAMVKAVSIPVTVKIRSGWAKGDWVDCEFAQRAENAGAQALTLHPRSQTMGFSGHSFWERIALVKKAISIPVIGNGDITSADEAVQMFQETGCDAIMIGRAALGNPWIFGQTRQALRGEAVSPVTPARKCALIIRQLADSRQAHGEERASREMKKQVAWYIHKLPGAANMRNRIFRSQSTQELESIAREYFGE